MSRKLDAALAEALGYEVVWSADMPWQVKNKKAYPPTRYSSDGNAMLKLDKEMRERGWDIEIIRYRDKWTANWWGNKGPTPIGMTCAEAMPKAAALAAYHALTGKEWRAE